MRASVPDIVMIQALAAKLKILTPHESNQLALLGFTVSVLYLLDRAGALRFEDTRMKLDAAAECMKRRGTRRFNINNGRCGVSNRLSTK